MKDEMSGMRTEIQEIKQAVNSSENKKSKRWEITGTWSGYYSNQERIVHREYTDNKKFADKVLDLGSISYTDGTVLYLNVRQMNYRERKQREVNAYKSLISRCVHQGVSSVSELK